MKKLFCILFLLMFCNIYAATTKTPISVSIDNIFSSSGYYCLDVYVGYDAERGCHIPTAIGFGWINRYLIGINTANGAYLQFANSSPQNKKITNAKTKWLCKINLTKSGDIDVNIRANKCTYTYQ